MLYEESADELQKAIDSVLNTICVSKLYLIDNSPTNSIEKWLDKSDTLEYIHTNKNLGFGSGHNLVLDKIKKNSDYHLVLNPDASFDSKILEELVQQLENNKELALVAPKVLFPNGEVQNSCRRYPKLSEMFFRRFPILRKTSKSIVNKGIYADVNLNEPFFSEYLTGCFHLYRTQDFIKIGGFDERYFLYMEDVDICKKIDQLGKKKMYYPKVHIEHVLKQRSAKDIKFFFRHTLSMIKYFMKWGF